MCGIVGFLDPRHLIDSPERVTATAMNRMAHRGPDANGQWSDQQAGIHLGHQRLSILDLSDEGAQPMVSRSGRYVLTFNGEIYNHLELRDELTGCGHRFRGTSDTETILAGIEEWGLDRCIKRCCGMFAAGLWDREESTLSLVRDRIGIKPLHVARWNGILAFASELNAFGALPSFPTETDPEAIRLLLQLNYIPAPWTIYRKARKLMPGCIMEIAAHPGAEPSVRRYWDLSEHAWSVRHEAEGDVADVTDRLDQLIRRCVGDRLISDVPLGAFLSGGVDSSMVVAAMQAQSSQPVKTFSIGFDRPEYDESPFARKVAEHLGTDHTEMVVTPDDCLETVPELAGIFDEPFADSSQIPTLIVSRLARSRVTVALSGDGGDEAFFGYNRYLWQLAYRRRLARWPAPILGLIRRTLRVFPLWAGDIVAPALRPFAPSSMGRNPDGDFLRKLADYLIKDNPETMVRRLSTKWADPAPVLAEQVPDTLPIPEAGIGLQTDADVANYMMWADQREYLPDDLLVKVDRTSMSTSLEARVPLLDHRLVDFAWSIPWNLKYREGQPKWILKNVLRRYLPDDLIDRPKMGFQVPVKEWLRGPLASWAGDLLTPAAVERAGAFQPEVVSRMWEEHRTGRRHWHYRLWSIIMFQAWYQQNADRRPA